MLSTPAGYAYRGKRLFDLVVVVLAAPVVGPVLVLLALGSWRMMGRPILFRQPRAGLGGRVFHIVKFRTMRDACGPDGRLLPDAERLTAFGRFLRSTSLDELPELLNVLRGEMSLVGPRPLLAKYAPLYSAHQRRRLDVVPGLTGLAQVEGRNWLSWEARFDLDVRYVEEARFGLDCGILARTVLAVVRRDGVSAHGNATMPEFEGSAAGASIAVAVPHSEGRRDG